MIQVWKKASRYFRSKVIVILGAAAIITLMLHIIPGTRKSGSGVEQKTVSSTPKIAVSTVNRQQSMSSPEKSHRNLIYTQPPVNGLHVNPYPFKFVTLPKPCEGEDLVIVVHSAVQYYGRRSVLRTTWLNKYKLEKDLGLATKIVFILGSSPNNTIVQDRINYEQEMYNDLVQSDFVDSYHNNTFKAISFMRWMSSTVGCPNALVVLKVDDDALIHPVKIPKLRKAVDAVLFSNSTDVYLGRLLETRVNRNPKSKWCVSRELWPHDNYPVWFQGLVYMLTPQLAAKLPSIALDVKYMFTDDVYVGILVSQVDEARVIIENTIGEHTEQSLDKFFSSFRHSGSIFYHVPSIRHFISWYYLDSDLISYDVAKPPPKNSGTKPPKKHATFPIGFVIIGVVCLFILVSCSVIYFACNRSCNT